MADGDVVEIKAVGKKIVITPQVVIDRSKFPSADDEYTPQQRRMVNARLNQAEKGPYYGPFRTGAEVAAFLKKKSRGRRPTKRRKLTYTSPSARSKRWQRLPCRFRRLS